jgi:hypothetical protein
LAERRGPWGLGLAAPLFLEVIVHNLEPLGPAQAPRPGRGPFPSRRALSARVMSRLAGGDDLDFDLATQAVPVIFFGHPNGFLP